MILVPPPLLLGVISTLAGLAFSVYIPEEDEFESEVDSTDLKKEAYMLYVFTNVLRTLCVAVVLSLFIQSSSLGTALILIFCYYLTYMLTYLALRETDLLPGSEDEDVEE